MATRIEKLRDKLRARDGTPGYEKNCEALRAEIARLEGSAAASGNETTSGKATGGSAKS